jgi:hypothetical protein
METNMQSDNRRVPFYVALDVTIWITVTGALMYASGWLWLLFFMSHFQASMFIIDVPVEFYLLYGFSVFIYALSLIIPILLLTFVLKFFYNPLSTFLRGSRALVLFVLVVAVAMIVMAKFAANHEYERQRKSDFSEYHPRVQVWLKPTTGDDSAIADLTAFLSNGCYRLLVQNQNMLLLFAHPPGMQLKRWPVIAMSLDEVIALQGLPQHVTPKCFGFSSLKHK